MGFFVLSHLASHSVMSFQQHDDSLVLNSSNRNPKYVIAIVALCLTDVKPMRMAMSIVPRFLHCVERARITNKELPIRKSGFKLIIGCRGADLGHQPHDHRARTNKMSQYISIRLELPQFCRHGQFESILRRLPLPWRARFRTESAG